MRGRLHSAFAPVDRQNRRLDNILYDGFPDGFFDRSDPTPDPDFYSWPRLVTHIDDDAIVAVGDLYEELGLVGEVLDLMSSWVSHFRQPPRRLTVLGMNAHELDANPHAAARVLRDLNADPRLPFADASFDAAVCCVSVDYLVRPIEVFIDVARVMRPGGPFVCTFSNRCFPTKAIRGGWRHRMTSTAPWYRSTSGAPEAGTTQSSSGGRSPITAAIRCTRCGQPDSGQPSSPDSLSLPPACQSERS